MRRTPRLLLSTLAAAVSLGVLAAGCGDGPAANPDYLVPADDDPVESGESLPAGQVTDPRPDPAPGIVATYGWDIRPCQVEEQISGAASCTLAEPTTVSVEVAGCEPGDHEIDNQESWLALLFDQCGFEGEDPLAQHDWTARRVLASVGSDEGCSAVSDTLWQADCADGVHWGYYFYACGICEREFTRLTAISLPRETAEVVWHACVPDVIRCIQ